MHYNIFIQCLDGSSFVYKNVTQYSVTDRGLLSLLDNDNKTIRFFPLINLKSFVVEHNKAN